MIHGMHVAKVLQHRSLGARSTQCLVSKVSFLLFFFCVIYLLVVSLSKHFFLYFCPFFVVVVVATFPQVKSIEVLFKCAVPCIDWRRIKKSTTKSKNYFMEGKKF